MFSDYDPMSSHNRLSNDDFEQYHAELQKLQDISDAFEQTHDEGKFWALSLRANCLANELANCRADLTASQSELDSEKSKNKQLDIGRLHSAFVFSSLSVACFIVFLSSSDLVFTILGILAAAILPLILWYLSYGIVQLLYSHHPDLYYMDEKKDKQIFVSVLVFPVILAVIYRIIGYWANK